MIIEDLIVELDNRLHKIAPRIETRWKQTSKENPNILEK